MADKQPQMSAVGEATAHVLIQSAEKSFSTRLQCAGPPPADV